MTKRTDAEGFSLCMTIRHVERAGIGLIVPDKTEQEFIHEKYMNELLKNIFLPETREALLAIVDRMKNRNGIEALILGGTELPLILLTRNPAVSPSLIQRGSMSNALSKSCFRRYNPPREIFAAKRIG